MDFRISAIYGLDLPTRAGLRFETRTGAVVYWMLWLSNSALHFPGCFDLEKVAVREHIQLTYQ